MPIYTVQFQKNTINDYLQADVFHILPEVVFLNSFDKNEGNIHKP